MESPYEEGVLFHGPSFQGTQRLVMGDSGSTSVINASSDEIPLGRINPRLLDNATHGIPHDRLNLWSAEADASKVAYPARISDFKIYGPTPRDGLVVCEVRFKGTLGSPDF